jgi:hypothetical protein
MSDPYMKAGRGGAGNFYTKQDLKDLEDAAKAEALVFLPLLSPCLSLRSTRYL